MLSCSSAGLQAWSRAARSRGRAGRTGLIILAGAQSQRSILAGVTTSISGRGWEKIWEKPESRIDPSGPRDEGERKERGQGMREMGEGGGFGGKAAAEREPGERCGAPGERCARGRLAAP